MFDALTPAEWDAIRLSPAGRERRGDRQPALRHRRRLSAGARALSAGARCSTHSSTCRWSCRRWSPATCCCSPSAGKGPIGAFLEQTFGIVLAFNWTGAALAAAIMGFPLMVRAIRLSIEAIDRRLEAAASTLGAEPRDGVRDHHAAPRPPRHPRRARPVVRPRARRVRRDHHLRRQHSGRHPDHSVGDLHLHAGARRRPRGAPPDRDRGRHLRSSRCSLSEALARRATRRVLGQ